MFLQRVLRTILVGSVLLLLASVMSAMAASNMVARSGLGETHHSINANDLKPPQCDSINLTNLITGSGNISGTLENDLILGSTGADTISGEGGNDCILGGGGDDTLIGNDGIDTCLGGPGSDTFDPSCEE
jgi:Ca2+-binding RTX toxin-like protein